MNTENKKKNNEKYLQDIFYMKKTIKIAKNGIYTTHPNPNVGCIIVLNGKIVGTGWHKKKGGPHAEVYAIKMAGKLAKNSTAYISLEPCIHHGETPPCCHLIVKSGIKRVVIAAIDPNPKVFGKGIKYLKKSGIDVSIGILAQESEKINYGFFKRMVSGIPWIQVKIAISLDGKIAMNNGESKWITGEQARHDVHKFRAKNSAILSTSNTILQDNPKLTVRYTDKIKNRNLYHIKFSPIKIILDSKNRIQPIHNIIHKTTDPVWLIRLNKDHNIWPKHVKQIIIQKYNNSIDLKKLLIFLGKKKINTLWVECGANLFSNMLNLGLIDELIIYIAPKMLGHTAKSLFLDYKNIKLKKTPTLKIKKTIKIGSDIRITLEPSYKWKK
ncbi:bifunctional diaminohydroxyphosphoribosylaminopyrimidine deaminase/5-amino-6-(5-phosphoribosylamino)uracil reductase RibD [Buchnera aphidicola]|uniref:bifunctional diaminohydroxyphosphoribosylaminopyrimidine deaminase/5-amino-6-(5-phosphoribosylamino)uracil reductase RibD n=1 Tax=Buchnera aphidicola TaxID=9 RepID=UPI0031B84FD3